MGPLSGGCVHVSQGVQGSAIGIHHAQACVGFTPGERGLLQLAEHSGDAAGVVPVVADVSGLATLHHL